MLSSLISDSTLLLRDDLSETSKFFSFILSLSLFFPSVSCLLQLIYTVIQ